MKRALLLGVLLTMTACSPDADAAGRFSDPAVAAMVSAACRGDTAEVKRLAGEGTDPNAKGDGDASPLSAVIPCKEKDGVMALLSVGADKDAVVEENTLPLIIALWSGAADVFRLLVEQGADIYKYSPGSERNAIGEAFLYGFETRDWDNFEYLFARGIDVNRFVDSRQADDIATFAARKRRYEISLRAIELGYSRDLKKLLKLAETDTGPQNERVSGDRALLIKRIHSMQTQ
jgi:ankyrin repeat protein